MKRRNARRMLWILTLLVLPVPFYLGEPELAPVSRLAFLSSLMGAVWLAEGGWAVRTFALLGVALALLYTGALWLVAFWIARSLDGLRAPSTRVALLAAIALGLVLSSFTELYDTPLSSERPRSNVFQLFE